MNAVLKPQAAPLRAAIYARNSKDNKNSPDESTASQILRCRQEAGERGWEIVRVFDEPDQSGQALGDRPKMQALLASAAKREFDVVMAVDSTRLARSEDLP